MPNIITLEFGDQWYISMDDYRAPLDGAEHKYTFPYIPVDIPRLFAIPLMLRNKDIIPKIPYGRGPYERSPHLFAFDSMVRRFSSAIDSLRKYLTKNNQEQTSITERLYSRLALGKRKKLVDGYRRKAGEIKPSILEDFLDSDDEIILNSKDNFFKDISKFGLDRELLETVFESGLGSTYLYVEKKIPARKTIKSVLKGSVPKWGGVFYARSMRISIDNSVNARVPIKDPLIVLKPDLRSLKHELKEYFVCQCITELLDSKSRIYDGLEPDEIENKVMKYFLELVDTFVSLDVALNPVRGRWIQEKVKRHQGSLESLLEGLMDGSIRQVIPDHYSRTNVVDFRQEWYLRQAYEALGAAEKRRVDISGDFIEFMNKPVDGSADGIPLSRVLARIIYNKLVHEFGRLNHMEIKEGTYPNIFPETEQELAEMVSSSLGELEKDDEKLYGFVSGIYSEPNAENVKTCQFGKLLKLVGLWKR